MDVKEAIFGRRSIRKYLDEPVSDEDIKFCIDAALAAPSNINLQPWYFVVIKSEGNFIKLNQIMGRIFERFKPVLENRFAKNPETIEETKSFLNSMGGAKIAVLVFLLKPDFEDISSVTQSTSAAIENFCLAAYSRGLGTCWMTALERAGLAGEIRETFAPDKGKFIAMITLGYPAANPKMPPRRDGRYTII
ncbi:MAG: nitroreductase family protein [Lachnospiraceae bacterium]|nr:nitroreductase family protein [Lachnospiraceae bacterium]